MFKPIVGGTQITIGEGFECYLPPIPDKSQIINYDFPREEQYWKRQTIPKWYLERSLEEEYKQANDQELVLAGKKKSVFIDTMCERYRRQEWSRRVFGVWFMNDGEPTYLTGHHYFYLNWCKADHKENDGYPFFYEFSKDNFYIRQWCEENPLSLGYMMIGPRGTGKSAEEIACITNNATRKHFHRVALQGKHFEDDSKKIMIQGKVVPLFNALPRFFKPEFAHGTNPQESLVFSRPAIKGKLGKSTEFGPDLELKSIMFAAMPGEKALDGETLGEIFESEIGKTDPKKVADIFVRHGVNVKCVFRNHRKVGLLRKESTVEEMDSGGDECHNLWKKSNPAELDASGWTKSKIHRHFISALDTDTSLDPFKSNGVDYAAPCNKYGKVDRRLSAIKIQNDFDAVKTDLKELSSRMRKSPRNSTEAFIKDQSKSIFNVMLLSNRLEHIRNHMPKPPYVRGNLFWLKDKFGPVWWERDDHAGRFNWAWFPDEFSQIKEPDKAKILNNVGQEWGYDRQGNARMMMFPKNDHLFRIGGDPIKYTRTKDPRASKAATHGFRLYDEFVDGGRKAFPEKWESHNFIFEYRNRPEDPETSYEDMAMACIFLGCKAMPERNITDLNRYFENNGLEKFLFYPQDSSDLGLDVQGKSDDAGLASTPEVINYYTTRIIQFINRHINRMPFDNTIEDWLDFDPTNPTKSDLTVSSGFTLIHAEKVGKYEEPPSEKISDWFESYDNSGISGRFAETVTD